MIAITLPEKVDDLLTRIYVVAGSIDTRGVATSLVKTRLRGLQSDLYDALQQIDVEGFQDEHPEAYEAIFDVHGWLCWALRFPGVRRDALAHTLEAIDVVRHMTLPY